MTSKIRAIGVQLSVFLLLVSGFVAFVQPAQVADARWCSEAGFDDPLWIEGDTCNPPLRPIATPTRSQVFTVACLSGDSFSYLAGPSDPYQSPAYFCRDQAGEPYDAIVQLGQDPDLSGLGVTNQYTYRCDGSTAAPSGTQTDGGYQISCQDTPGSEGLYLQSTQVLTPTIDPGQNGDCPSGYYLSGDTCIRGEEPDPGSTPNTTGCDGETGDGFNPDCPGALPTGSPQVLSCSDPDNIGEGDSPILCQLIRIVRFLSIGVSVTAAITVAVVGTQYTMSRGDPSKTAQAIQRIVKVGAGIVVYVFGWALLEFMIPGGAL